MKINYEECRLLGCGNVSEERVSSIFRIEERTRALSELQSVNNSLTRFLVRVIFSTLKMEVTSSSETSVYKITTSHHRESLKFYETLERGPLSLVSTTEELLDRKVAAPV
jgi:hypothetical protein